MLQLPLQGVVGPGKGLQDVPQGMLTTALGGCNVVEVVLKSSNFLFAESHAFSEPAPDPDPGKLLSVLLVVTSMLLSRILPSFKLNLYCR